MSGGRWGMYRAFDENEDALSRLKEGNALLKEIEHQLDYGVCSDICLACAQLRILAALEQFFGDYGHAGEACEILRDCKQNLCPRCLERG